MEIDIGETNVVIPKDKLRTLLSVQNNRIKALLKSSHSNPSNPPKIEENIKERKETSEILCIEDAKYIQYSSLYISRLSLCIDSIRRNAQTKWAKVLICKKILDLKGNVTIKDIIPPLE